MKRLLLLIMVVAFHILLLTACGENNTCYNSNDPNCHYNNSYNNRHNQGRHDYNNRYGDHFRRFPRGYDLHDRNACGQGWRTGLHYQQRENFCFDASFQVGFNPYRFDNYPRVLCDLYVSPHNVCPWGSYCQPVDQYSDYGFCVRAY